MNVALGFVILLVTTVLTSTAMVLARRRAPEGSWFADGDRASGVFGVLATGFSVLLGFLIFLSFESYDASRAGAESEATLVAQQVQTAQFFPAELATELSGELVCYARSVAGAEWAALDDGTLDDAINPWGAELFRSVQDYEPGTPREQSAYDRWMDQTDDRQQARVERVHGVDGIIPVPLWLVLFLVSGVIFVYMLFFADRAERARTQVLLMSSVTVTITLLLMLVAFFDDPHGSGVGRLQPTAMERTLRIVDEELAVAGIVLDVPCDEEGVGV